MKIRHLLLLPVASVASLCLVACDRPATTNTESMATPADVTPVATPVAPLTEPAVPPLPPGGVNQSPSPSPAAGADMPPAPGTTPATP